MAIELAKACLSCGQPIDRRAFYCSTECRPKCEGPQCKKPVRGLGPYCDTHRMQFARLGIVKPLRWASEWVCVVCGADVAKGSGRRKHCSNACQVADSRKRKGLVPQGEYRARAGTDQTPRQAKAICHLCGNEFSLGRRKSDGRLQRLDTKWCRTCGRESPEAIRFKRYGITPEQYEAAVQHGCAICRRTDRKLHVDHDHSCCAANKFRTCGQCVRGLICGPCNRAIGMFGDDVDVVKTAIRYLAGDFALPSAGWKGGPTM